MRTHTIEKEWMDVQSELKKYDESFTPAVSSTGGDIAVRQSVSAHQHEPLRLQEKCSSEHAGRGLINGQLVPA